MIPAKKASPSTILLRELPLPDTTSPSLSDPLSLSVTPKVRVGYITGKVPTSTVSQLQPKMQSSVSDVVKPKVTEAQALRSDPDKFLATKYSIPDRPAMRQRGGVSSKPLRPYKPRAAKLKGQAAQQTASNLASRQHASPIAHPVPSSIHQTTASLLKPYGDIDPLGHPVSPSIPVAPTSVSPVMSVMTSVSTTTTLTTSMATMMPSQLIIPLSPNVSPIRLSPGQSPSITSIRSDEDYYSFGDATTGGMRDASFTAEESHEQGKKLSQ